MRNALLRSAAAALVAALAALGAPAGSQAQDVVTLDFWDMMWGGPNYPGIGQRLVDEWNSENPGIQVKYRTVPWANWYETYVTAVATGSAPDLSTGASFQPIDFYSQDAILPIDELYTQITTDGSIKDFQESAVSANAYDGRYISLPWATDIRAWHYRKDLLEAAGIQPPTTWDELRAAAKALTGNGVYGLVGSGDTEGSKMLLATTLNNGGGLFAEDGSVALNSERSKEALDFIAALKADGSVDPGSAGYDGDQALQVFLSGKAAFILAGTGLSAEAGPEVIDKVGLLPPLKGPHGDTGTIAWSASIMAYNQTKHPQEVMAFMKWWSEHEKPLWTEGASAMLPARISFQQDAFFTQNPIVSGIVSEYLPVAKFLYTHASGPFPELNQVEGDGVLQTLIQQLWQGRPVDEVLPAAQARLEEIRSR